jgi:alcohol dehydrogenase class IV
MHFEFGTASRIIFEPGSIRRVPEIAKTFGAHALVVTGRNTTRAAELLELLEGSTMRSAVFSVPGEPTLDAVRRGANQAREGVEVVIGLGGGSAMDAAKAIAVLATNSGEPLDYLEVIGQGRPLENAPLPVIAIPTTAGTGAEVTRNAVLGSEEHRVKASLRGPYLLPKVAVVDPDLTLNLPPQVTAHSGLDTLTQLLEPFVSVKANSFTDLFCLEGLRRVRTSLRTAYREPDSRQARQEMSFCSLLSGLALANAGLGIVHGFAAPLGGMLDAPHGAICAAILPHALSVNVRALRQRDAGGNGLERFRKASRVLAGRSDAQPDDCVRFAQELCEDFGSDSYAGRASGKSKQHERKSHCP